MNHAPMNEAMPSGFLLPYDIRDQALCSLVGDQRCVAGATTDFALRFFDSFDWRLHRAGLRLSQAHAQSGTVLRLRSVDGQDLCQAQRCDAQPGWPVDLPQGALRDRVQALLEMRVLLPLAHVQGVVTELRVLNEDAKTVARIHVLRMTCDGPQVDEPRTLWPRLRIYPVRGYQAESDALARLFDVQMQWSAAPLCLFEEAMTAVGLAAGDYSSKLTISLSPQSSALRALRKVLLVLLDTLERNVPGVQADLDTEFLHDLRVATRRTRSALAQLPHVLPEALRAEFRERFGWLGRVTGPTRDLDVFLLELPLLADGLPVGMRGDLEPLRVDLQRQRQTAYSLLNAELASPGFRALLCDWRSLLEAGEIPGEQGWLFDLPVETVVSQRIWRMYRKVLKAGRAIQATTPAEALHELRKDCKKLRYLIEFFRSLYSEKPLGTVVSALKQLLNDLGTFQDRHVQAERLLAIAAGLADDDSGTRLRCVLAIGALMARLEQDQAAARQAFSGSFARFDSADTRRICKSLFRPSADTAS